MTLEGRESVVLVVRLLRGQELQYARNPKKVKAVRELVL